MRVNTVAPGPTLTERTAAFADRIAPISAHLRGSTQLAFNALAAFVEPAT